MYSLENTHSHITSDIVYRVCVRERESVQLGMNLDPCTDWARALPLSCHHLGPHPAQSAHSPVNGKESINLVQV